MNNKALSGLKLEAESIQELKDTHNFIDELEEELEWYCRNASDEEERIIHLENSLDKLYRKLELLEKL
jgi:hypothetical protein